MENLNIFSNPPLALFALSVFGGLYLFFEWLRDRRRYGYLLWFSLGLLFLYFFQIPSIKSFGGEELVLSDFNLFFTISFLLNFLGLLFIYGGVVTLAHSFISKKMWWFLSVWFLFGCAWYYIAFQMNMMTTSHIPFLGGIFLFFVPLRLLILISFLKHCFYECSRKTRLSKLGGALVSLALILGILRALFIFKIGSVYSPSLWFFSLQSPYVFFAQAIGVLLLTLGFIFLHRSDAYQ